MSWHIAGSVGRWELQALNRRADVETVQTLLTAVAARTGIPAYDPGGIDGAIRRPSTLSDTVRAIEAFQARFMQHPDGLIAVGGRTFRELRAASGLQPPAPPSNATGVFPFRAVPAHLWTSSPRSFGANRHGQNGPRAHAGCDLYAPVGTPVHAVADGKVLANPYPFYAQTWALEVDHGAFVARYGEIRANNKLRKGDVVLAGDEIAHVGKLVGVSVPSNMLHFEVFAGTASGPLTRGAAESKRHANGRLFYRRKDLLDPTPFLNDWRNRLPV